MSSDKISQVPDITLYTYHVLGPRQTFQNLAIFWFLCVDFRNVKYVIICFFSTLIVDTVNGAEYASGITVSLVVYIILCVRFTFIVANKSTTLDNGGWLNLAM